MTDSPTAVLFRDIGGLVGPVVEGLSLVKTVADFVVDFVVTGCVDGVLRSNKKREENHPYWELWFSRFAVLCRQLREFLFFRIVYLDIRSLPLLKRSYGWLESWEGNCDRRFDNLCWSHLQSQVSEGWLGSFSGLQSPRWSFSILRYVTPGLKPFSYIRSLILSISTHQTSSPLAEKFSNRGIILKVG